MAKRHNFTQTQAQNILRLNFSGAMSPHDWNREAALAKAQATRKANAHRADARLRQF